MKVLFFVVAAMMLFSCGGASSSKSGSSSDSLVVQEEQGTPQTKWVYLEQVDEMTDIKTKTAYVEANEELNFEFPYSGGTKVWIRAYQQGNNTSAMLCIAKNKGQFIPAAMGGRYVTVRFDDKPAEKYLYVDPSDYSSETIFIKNAEKFIANLKEAKVTLVQCEFFNEGVRNIKFDTAGLEW